jgi:hypothetical protein
MQLRALRVSVVILFSFTIGGKTLCICNGPVNGWQNVEWIPAGSGNNA